MQELPIFLSLRARCIASVGSVFIDAALRSQRCTMRSITLHILKELPLMRRLVLPLLLAFAISPGLIRAQDSNAAPTVAEAGPAEELSAESVQASGDSDLAEAELLPRATRPYWHVFIAFAIAWGLLFGYAITLGRRFTALESQVKQLKRS